MTDLNDQPDRVASLPARCLSFACADERFAVDIMIVREIVGSIPTTWVPGAPPELVGVANLRGRVLPTLDFARLVGLPSNTDPDTGCAVVVAVGDHAVGVVVDRVCGVVQPTEGSQKPVPDVRVDVGREHLESILMFDDLPHFLIRLDHLVRSTGILPAPRQDDGGENS